MSPARYVLDSSFLIKLHREQPPEIYVSLWNRLSALLAAGEGVIPREADREMQRKDDPLRSWLRDRQASVVESTDEELVIVQAISRRYPDWVRGQKNAADPFLVAAALTRDAVVVTDERHSGSGAADHHMRLPNVAEAFDVETIAPTELIRRCGWTF